MKVKAIGFALVLCALVCFVAASCVADLDAREYKVGDIGPAGGYIFYDCDADNDSGNADGLISSSCGWRYLEVAPTDAGKFSFGYLRPDGTTNTTTSASQTAIGSGKANTKALVKSMGESTYTTTTASTSKSSYAAISCANYTVEVGSKVYDDWFLPSKDELDVLYAFVTEFGLLDEFSDYDYWTSSEQQSSNSWLQNFSTGAQHPYAKSDDNYVRAIRAFL